MMKPEDWQRVKELCGAALQRPLGERSEFLATACSDDSVRSEVETLLASYESQFMEQPVIGNVAEMIVNRPGNILSPGEHISHFEIVRLIGTGGMGDVYLAQDTQLRRNVALKVLRADLIHNRDRLHRFVQEARAAATLNHPNIAHIYEVGEVRGTAFFAMELIDGETLREKIHRHKTNLERLLEWLSQVTDGLAKAHAAGIVHRDLTPDNVMISRDGYAKILDFGLAKLLAPQKSECSDADSEEATVMLLQPLSTPGMILGTVGYMSPEQAQGLAKIDARSDIFSFGCILYEAATKQQPFSGETVVDSLHKIVHAQPAPVKYFNPTAPIDLQRVVRRCLAKDPDDRYQTIKDVATELKELLRKTQNGEEVDPSISPKTTNDSGTFEPSNVTLGGHDKTRSTADVIAQKSSRAKYLVGATRLHKLGAAIAVAVLLTFAFGVMYFPQHRATKTPIDSIAVMPFENMSHEQNSEYISDGVTESLINSLSQVPNTTVIARNSVFRYKNQKPDMQEVARQLNVQALLTGRVLVQGDSLSISVELTDTQNNTQLWGQRYTRKAADILAVQDEIARQVTETLRVRLSGGQQEQVTKRYTENVEAYRLYLLGRYYTNTYSEENIKRAIPFFDKAIALDPRYALAYAARGECFSALGDLSLPMSEAMAKAKQDIAAALSIDDNLVEARATQAWIKSTFDWDFAGAEGDFKRAIALNPNHAAAHRNYAWHLAMLGRPTEGAAEMNLAQQLNPVDQHTNVDVSVPYYLARQFDQSIAQSRKAIEMFPDFYLGHLMLGSTLFQKGDHSTGIVELEKAKAIEPTPHLYSCLAYAYGKAGRQDDARKLLVELQEISKRRHVAPYLFAMIYIGLDEKDEAFVWLEKAYQERSWWLLWIKMDPMVDSLRSDARFNDLMRRLGFPQ
jgi:eukaryotic-like serine/threonine-protein kinase